MFILFSHQKEIPLICLSLSPFFLYVSVSILNVFILILDLSGSVDKGVSVMAESERQPIKEEYFNKANHVSHCSVSATKL